MRYLIVGTKNSITAYAIDHELSPSDYLAVSKSATLQGIYPDAFENPAKAVIITYGFASLPPLEALGITDRLTAIGFDRKNWSYK